MGPGASAVDTFLSDDCLWYLPIWRGSKVYYYESGLLFAWMEPGVYFPGIWLSGEALGKSRGYRSFFFLSGLFFLLILPLKYTYSVLPKYVYLQKSHCYA